MVHAKKRLKTDWVCRPKYEIPGKDMGFLAYILDTEKNVMGIWSAS